VSVIVGNLFVLSFALLALETRRRCHSFWNIHNNNNKNKK
jgi:hypothetical protein